MVQVHNAFGSIDASRVEKGTWMAGTVLFPYEPGGEAFSDLLHIPPSKLLLL